MAYQSHWLNCICFYSPYLLNSHVGYSNSKQEIENKLYWKILSLRPGKWCPCIRVTRCFVTSTKTNMKITA